MLGARLPPGWEGVGEGAAMGEVGGGVLGRSLKRSSKTAQLLSQEQPSLQSLDAGDAGRAPCCLACVTFSWPNNPSSMSGIVTFLIGTCKQMCILEAYFYESLASGLKALRAKAISIGTR